MKTNMKIFLLLSTLIITSCDPEYQHNFYIKNHCKESIKVNVYYNERYAYPASGKPLITDFMIGSDSSKLIGSESSIGSFDNILYYFDSIVIKKDGKISNIDYLDYSRWDSKKKSKRHTESYLIVTPEDFEDE